MQSIFLPPESETQNLIAEFTVKGEPTSKARPRFTKRGYKGQVYTPQRTLDAEAGVQAAFLKATKRKFLEPEAAYAVHIHFHNGTRQRRDIDNMVKLVLDGLNGAAWVDDNQVLEVAARKSFVTKAEAHTHVRIYVIGDMGFTKQSCKQCHKEFRTYPSWQRGGDREKLFCSRACHTEYRRRARERTCEHCNETFLIWGESKKTRFCSKECYSATRTVDINCVICGTEFRQYKSWVEMRPCCSPECSQERAKRKRAERRTTHFPGTCRICGAGTTRKEYKRCNACKLANKQVPEGA